MKDNVAAAKAALLHLDIEEKDTNIRASSRDFFWYSPVLKDRLDHVVADFVVRLTPIGVFAIAASTAGTIRIDEFDRLQVYFVTSVLTWGLLTFWTLPMLVVSRSPLTLRGILKHSRTPLLTAFATGSLLVVLPLLADAIKRILESHDIGDDPAIVDIVVPVSYSLPSGSLYLCVAFLLT